MQEIKIGKGKERTLKRLREKKEETKNYPINYHDLLIIDGCNLCGSQETSKITELYLNKELNFFSTDTCNNCLYTFRSVSPSFEWFNKCWKTIADGKLEVFNPEIEKIRENRYKSYLKMLSDHISTGLMLDIGAAYGTGARVFQNNGFKVETVEPEDNKANYIEKKLGIPVVNSSIESLVLTNRNYDLIIFAHCLEHLDNPFFIMSNIKNILKPNGILYLETPILWNHVTWNDALFLTHKSNFTEENLRYLANKNGFQILDSKYFQHTKKEPFDLGLVLKQIDNIKEEHNCGKIKTINDIRTQYRKNLPLKKSPPLNRVLRYNVDHIEHFYQTIRLDYKEVVEPKNKTDFISFRTK